MSNSNTKIQSQTDMKQKLLNILSEKNSKVTSQQKPCSSLDYYSLQRKLSQRSHKLPVEMTKFERERWLFEMLNTQDLAQQEQELKEIYVSQQRNQMEQKEALQNEIDLLRSLLEQS